MSLDPKYGGPTTSVPIQCMGTQKLGAKMELVTSESSRPYERELLDNGVSVIEIPLPRNAIAGLSFAPLRKFLSSGEIDSDILHLHGVWKPSCSILCRYGRKKGIPYVVNPRGDLEKYRVNRGLFKRIKKEIAWLLYAKKNLNNAACILATSEQEATALLDRGVKAPVAIIPNGIVVSHPVDRRVYLDRDKKVLLFLSRVNPIKGIELLIQAWAAIPMSIRNNWELHIVGNSDPYDYIESLRSLVRALDLQDSVLFLGPLKGEDKVKKYLSSDLFVLPTFNENFGNVIAEAMMYGCPVITTTNAPWKCISDSKCGWWIDLSLENLINAISSAMLLSDDQRIELGQRARTCVIENYSIDVVSKMTIDLYSWVLSYGKKPPCVL